MASSSYLQTSLRKTKRILAALLAVGFVVGFLLTPLGFETREPDLRSPSIAVYFTIVGLLLPILGAVLVFRRPKVAGVLAVIDAAFLFFTAPADQIKVFFTVTPPLAVTIGEFILIALGIGYMLFGQRLYMESR